MISQPLPIYLIGPGGAGKSTIGALIADRLEIPFIDLDACFADRAGDITEYINRFGYEAYAQNNVEIHRSLAYELRGPRVTALS